MISVKKTLVTENGYGTLLNAQEFIAEHIWTFRGNQYIVFINASGRVTVGKRKLPDGEWSLRDTGRSVDTSDFHNVASLGIDKEGYIHICYGMHSIPLQYIRSNNPEDITSFSSASMTGNDENQVTYPTFFTDKDGELLFFFRSGVAGAGVLNMNKYNVDTKSWIAVHRPLISGNGTAYSPYWGTPVLDSKGNLHMTWCYRAADQTTNLHVCYAKSPDGGLTWLKSNGDKYAIPITLSDAEIIDPVQSGQALFNDTGVALDSYDRPHVAYIKRAPNGHMNYFHAWHDGDSWRVNQVTNFTHTPTDMFVVDISKYISRPAILVAPDDTVLIIFRDSEDGNLKVASVFPPEYTECSIDTLGEDNWGWMEPKFDRKLWAETGELHIVAQRMRGINPEPIYVLECSAWKPEEGVIQQIEELYKILLASAYTILGAGLVAKWIKNRIKELKAKLE